MSDFNTEIKSAIDGIKAGIGSFDQKFNDLQRQVDFIDQKMQAPNLSSFGPGGGNPLQKALEGSEDLRALMGGRRKSALIKIDDIGLNLKTTITSGAVGSATSGVLNYERVPGVVPLAQRRNFMRDIIPMKPTTASGIDFIKELAFTNAASPQVEASAKGESALTFTTDIAPVRTIAHWIPATKQVLDDFAELMDTVSRKLIFGYLLREDAQILFGSGTGNDLDGLANQAEAFSTSLLSASNGWEKADILRRSMQQVERGDEAAVGWFVVNSDDWADIELTKDSQGRYIAGDPRSVMAPTLWNKPVVVTSAMPSGLFLAGSGEAADLRVRQDITVEVSTEHSTFFTENKVAIRCEGRVALPVYRPNALIYGSFTTSPA